MTAIHYEAGGWLAPSERVSSWQRDDQGKDLVIPWRGVLQAPGSWTCIGIGHDRPFPSGFGPEFPLIAIHDGPWARFSPFYIGHCTTLVRDGQHGAFGHAVARADQGHNFEGTSGGWVEFGQFNPATGKTGNDAPTHPFDSLLRNDMVINVPYRPLVYGSQGPSVLRATGWLRDCGWLTRRWWHFNRPVHGAVVAFQRHHGIRANRGKIDEHTSLVLRRSAHWCRRHHRKET